MCDVKLNSSLQSYCNEYNYEHYYYYDYKCFVDLMISAWTDIINYIVQLPVIQVMFGLPYVYTKDLY